VGEADFEFVDARHVGGRLGHGHVLMTAAAGMLQPRP
jgi:hypothetical protein